MALGSERGTAGRVGGGGPGAGRKSEVVLVEVVGDLGLEGDV